MPFLVIFVVIPLIEISLFIIIGGRIGVPATLLISLGTAILGGAIFRYQGIQTFHRAMETMNRTGFPAKELFDGFCLVIAAAVLITPGFLTDVIGFLLLVPRARDILRRQGRARFGGGGGGGAAYTFSAFSTRTRERKADTGRRPARKSDIIDAEFEEIDSGDDSDDRT